MDRHVIILLG